MAMLTLSTPAAGQDGSEGGGGSSSGSKEGFGPDSNGTDKVRQGASAEGDTLGVETIVERGSGGEQIGTVPAPQWVFGCTWSVWTWGELWPHEGYDVPVVLVGDSDIDVDVENQRWSVVSCPRSVDTGGALFAGYLNAWPEAERPPQAFFDWLVLRTYASVRLPIQVGQGAPFGDEDAPMITQLPTWLWVDPAIWAPVSVTSPPVFGHTATVTATPVNVVFEGADQVVDCGANEGPVYDFNRSGEEQDSDCTITYRHSSAVGDWDLASRITWDVSYSCSAGCNVGTLRDLVTPNSRPVRVAELQAILTASG